jgi:hypothetical protein
MKYIYLFGIMANMLSAELLFKTNPTASFFHFFVGLFLAVLVCMELKIGGKK